MNFIEDLKNYSERVIQIKDKIQNEEATKHSLILPFFQILGYDIFNPEEVIPEFGADIREVKKGEKVDYVIKNNEEIAILVEAKSLHENLKRHDNQLTRYFNATKSRIGILTNGIQYLFFTDLDESNKMDKKPFFEFDVIKSIHRENHLFELKKFQKRNFDIENIISTAEELKYINEIKKLLHSQIEFPEDHFVDYLSRQVYSGKRRSPNIKEKFKDIIKKSFTQFLNEIVRDTIEKAISKDSETEIEEESSLQIKNEEENTFTSNKKDGYKPGWRPQDQ